MFENQDLRVNIIGDASKLNQALGRAEGRLKSFSSSLSKIGTTLTTRLTVPLGIAAGASFKMAADFDESLNKVQVSFRDTSDEVIAFSKTALSQLGLSQAQALETAALFGDMATGMGATTKEASSMATSLTALSADLASFKNIQQDVAQTALASVFTGETESLKKLGIVMTETNLKEFARQQGIQKSIKDMTQLEKVELRYQFVMAKTQNAQGDFARTSGSASNQLRTLQNTLIELGTKIGQVLLPPVTKIIQKITGLLNNFIALDSEAKKQIVTFGLLAASLGPVLLIFSQIAKVIAFVMSPIGAVITGIAALGAAFLYLKDNWEAVKERIGDWSWWKNMLIGMIQFFIENNPFALIIKGINSALEYIGKDLIPNPFEKFSNEYLEELKDTNKEYEHEFKNFGESIKNQLAGVGNIIGNALGLGGGGTAAGGGREQIGALDVLQKGLKKASGSFYQFGLIAKQVTNEVLENSIKPLGAQLQTFGETLIPQIGQALADGFAAIAQGENPIKRLTTLIKGLVVRLIAAAAAAAVLSAILTGGKAGAFLPKFKSLMSGMLNIPGMASGGIAFGQTPVMVGDYSGVRSNPEVIAPLNKLQAMIGNGSQNVQGEFVLRGQDLVVALQRAERNRNRFK